MRILLLSDSNSPHTIRWAKSINKLDHEVGIFSFHEIKNKLYLDTPDIELFSINVSRDIQTKSEVSLSKLIYIKAVSSLKEIIKKFQPTIIHAHYASSYGFIGSLSRFHPFIISVWGGDVFNFPKYSILHKYLLKYSLSKADRILSTSRIMKEETKKYTNKEIIVTPFGVDTNKFYPRRINGLFNQDDIVIGTIKTLEERYGVKYLIRAFSQLKKMFPHISLKLLIVGDGTLKKSLKELTKELGVESDTKFTGFVDHSEVSDYHNMLDIYVAMSIQESFGVAVLESSACCKPVVVSNVGGLPEVVDNESSGFIVETKNYLELTNALVKLISNSELRYIMGSRGRNKVLKEYDWNVCVKQMDAIYKSIITH